MSLPVGFQWILNISIKFYSIWNCIFWFCNERHKKMWSISNKIINFTCHCFNDYQYQPCGTRSTCWFSCRVFPQFLVLRQFFMFMGKIFIFFYSVCTLYCTQNPFEKWPSLGEDIWENPILVGGLVWSAMLKNYL